MKDRIFRSAVLASIFLLLITASALHAEDTYYYVAVKDLNFIDGSLPVGSETGTERNAMRFGGMHNNDFIRPYAIGSHGEEIYLYSEEGALGLQFGRFYDENLKLMSMAVRAEAGQVPLGRIYLPQPDFKGLLPLEFSLEGVDSLEDQDACRSKFYEAKENHYRDLMTRQGPGAAWFRHQRDAALYAREGEEAGSGADRSAAQQQALEDLQGMYDLFSGGRAVSENLRLDRDLGILDETSDLKVPLDSITGITTQEMNWKALIQGQAPENDALARAVPFDQHALFFASFQDMIKVSDEADTSGTLILHAIEPRAEDARTRQRYEEQLCLSSSLLSRLLGPALISSVAFTGSDPFLRTGSDVAVLFEAVNMEALEAAIAARQAQSLAAHPEAEASTGTVAGDVPFKAVTSPDRKVCSYMATDSGIVVVTNSLVQLERIIDTLKGEVPSLTSLDEYTFFRTRYAKGDPGETAFLIVTDAAIRRWCSPRWRIADSRRTRAAAVLAELQARHLTELDSEAVAPRSLNAKRPVPGMGNLLLDAQGVHSSVYGSLEFMTPVAELDFDTVSEEERQAYESFRLGYMRQWSRFFDPIAARLQVKPEEMSIDLTVMPLTFASDYRDFMEFTGNMRIPEGAGDPHPEAALHVVMAFDAKSDGVRQASSFAAGMAPSTLSDPISWIGRWAALYLDEDPFWEKVRAAYEQGGWESLAEFMEGNITHIPVAFHLEATNALKLAAFLTGVRAFSEQAAPGMTVWETFKHGEQPYVKVSATETVRAAVGGEPSESEWSIYYVPMPDRLIVSLNENTLKRAMDRVQAAKSADTEQVSAVQAGDAPWTDQSMGIRMRKSVWLMLQALFNEEFRATLERGSWNNIAALNEWRRVFGADDAVAFHRKFWYVDLQCPGGGEYVWNETYQTFESTVFSHPGEPEEIGWQSLPLPEIDVADFGLTFENDGLRAKAALHR